TRARYLFRNPSRCLISFSSSSVCRAIRSALRLSSPAPENAAACSINCRILSRAIAIRRSSSPSEREGPSFMVESSSSQLPTIPGHKLKRYARGAAIWRGGAPGGGGEKTRKKQERKPAGARRPEEGGVRGGWVVVLFFFFYC